MFDRGLNHANQKSETKMKRRACSWNPDGDIIAQIKSLKLLGDAIKTIIG